MTAWEIKRRPAHAWEVARRNELAWALDRRAALAWEVEAAVANEAPVGFQMGDYGTAVAYYSMAEDTLADGASVSQFSELLGTGPTMEAPSASNEALYVLANKSLDFDGSDRYEPTPATSAFNTLHQECTFAATFEVNTGLRALFGNGTSSSLSGVNASLVNRQPRFYVNAAAGNAYILQGSTLTLGTTATWICTFDGVGGSMWLNGTKEIDETSPIRAPSTASRSNEYRLGSTFTQWPWVGEIVKVLIWSTKITDAAHIAAIQAELEA